MQRRVVEAIHEGRLIRAYEDEALREGLYILRFVDGLPSSAQTKKVKPEEEKKLLFDDYRRPLRNRDNVSRELADNFHWMIMEKRKSRGMTRKQFAEAIRASENDVKMIENGVLPSPDFVLINRIEQLFGITLRKNPVYAQASQKLASIAQEERKPRQQRDFRQVVEKVRQEKDSAIAKPAEQMVEEIEIVDEEDK
jgi:ribosome-binding protein aMBF1 (putative translation factor)